MKLAMSFVSCCGAIIACAALMSVTAQEKQKQSKPPTIAFSQDEKTVNVNYDKGEWTFHRPAITPWSFTASGKMLWVSTTGDDANDGSTDKPFRTISKAVETVTAGDVIYIRARPRTWMTSTATSPASRTSESSRE